MSDTRKGTQGSLPVYQIKLEKDVYVPTRDGVRLAVDIFRPDAEGKFPALLAYGQYGKELEQMGLTLPPQARPSPLWDGAIEGGDTKYIVPRGYELDAILLATPPPAVDRIGAARCRFSPARWFLSASFDGNERRTGAQVHQ